ncbi:hypothetical protein [Caulobacter sp. BK020]|uniref:hypothetical protein n=1 Tax=Caulobacter sp. BK020 TaxID=2512117 RepID=UPI00104FF8FC|nr:hypothetical protein [Caulobacter sp. BK020]TCS14563.1 hypothetical protein EV278_107212 [Caulobacter sp. BK020]
MTVFWTETDAATWRAFVAEAWAVARKPSRAVARLRRAAKKAGKAVPPTADDLGRGHCILLWKFATTFVALDDAGRAENADKLADHASLANGWVNPVSRAAGAINRLMLRPELMAPPPALRKRRDIDDMED